MNNISPLDIYYPEELVDKCQIVKAIAINRESKALFIILIISSAFKIKVVIATCRLFL